MEFKENKPRPENRIEGRETNVFKSTPSTQFEITSSDEKLRKLMFFMQQEGIAAQNTISESREDNAQDRQFILWVNNDDAEKITKYLADQAILGN